MAKLSTGRQLSRAKKCRGGGAASLSEERQREEFRKVFNRDPSSDDELEVFIEYLTLERYNAGHDEV